MPRNLGLAMGTLPTTLHPLIRATSLLASKTMPCQLDRGILPNCPDVTQRHTQTSLYKGHIRKGHIR